MSRRFPWYFLAVIALAAGGASAAVAVKKQRPTHPTVLPPPRDGNIAVQEELDVARRARTLAAYDLFLSRHGDHPLAAAARRERAALAGKPRR